MKTESESTQIEMEYLEDQLKANQKFAYQLQKALNSLPADDNKSQEALLTQTERFLATMKGQMEQLEKLLMMATKQYNEV